MKLLLPRSVKQKKFFLTELVHQLVGDKSMPVATS